MARRIVVVLTDTYNYEDFIEQATANVLEQDLPSSDAEMRWCQEYGRFVNPELYLDQAVRGSGSLYVDGTK